MTRVSAPKPTPETTIKWLEETRSKARSADIVWAKGEPRTACELLHDTAELALKTLCLANNKRFTPGHDIYKLWRQAEDFNGPLDVKKTDGQKASAETLAALTRYSGADQYDWAPLEIARKDFTELSGTVHRLVTYAGHRTPELLDARRRKQRMFGPEAAPAPTKGR